MRIKEITFAVKKGLPEYSSVMSSITLTVSPKDKLDDVWDKAKQETLNNLNLDPSWINKDEKNND